MAAKFHEQSQGNCNVFNIDRRILLPDTILIHDEILATDVWDEVPVWILHKQLNGHGARGGI